MKSFKEFPHASEILEALGENAHYIDVNTMAQRIGRINRMYIPNYKLKSSSDEESKPMRFIINKGV